MTYPNAACFCGRQGGGFIYSEPGIRDAPAIRACSMKCLSIITLRKGDMTQPLTQDEYGSIQESAQEIGEFLEATGKTDMAELSYEQWLDFIAFAYTTICDRNRAKWATDDGVPF